MKRIFIKVEGIVQGVGFRPFIYNLALFLNLSGWVGNNSEGVHIDLQGTEDSIGIFLHNLNENPPPLARIENVIIEERQLAHFSGFEIKASEANEEKMTLISPDTATCAKCTQDIMNPENRRYRYPFTNCTDCGPRFSIIKNIPYDRKETTMSEFKMCSACGTEYSDPSDRRFHAQPNACEKCGPRIWVEDNKGNRIETTDVFKLAQQLLKEGKIIALKGIGGFNFICNATDEKAVELLRKRKKRPHKPFAVMIKDIHAVRKYCKVNSTEEHILSGVRKPIVILEQHGNYSLPDNIAPMQNTLGVMLPYSPLHMLLFSETFEVIVTTSANVPGLPMEYINENARKSLAGMVDYYIFHNRDIYNPIDDSVTKVVKEEERIIRRARGYVPEPINSKGTRDILACGSNSKNTFCIAKDGFLFLSQHNGNLENIETNEIYKNNIEHFKRVFSFNAQYLACDMHPGYESSKYADSFDLPKVLVQHHHAHIASCMAENDAEGEVIGVAFDGTGYGTDGKIWGGEFLVCSAKEFKRAGHLNYIKMPGGEKAVKEPWRMGVAYIFESLKEDKDLDYRSIVKNLWGSKSFDILKAIEADINCPETSSMGRFFDAVSSIIGLRDIISYDGQGAAELEALIRKKYPETYSYNISKTDCYVLKVHDTIKEILEDIFRGIPKEILSSKFHNTVIKFTVEMCKLIRNDYGVNKAALSGGVFQNAYLLGNITEELEREGFIVYTHKKVPCNDGGLSLGQIIVADEII